MIMENEFIPILSTQVHISHAQIPTAAELDSHWRSLRWHHHDTNGETESHNREFTGPRSLRELKAGPFRLM
jgi:hypothetical protein